MSIIFLLVQDTKNKFDKKKKIDLIRNVCLSRPVDVSHQEKEKVLEKNFNHSDHLKKS